MESKPVYKTGREDETGKVQVYEKLRQVLTWEQLDFLANHLLEMQAAAIAEHADQQLVIVFNDKGHPRHLNRWVGLHFPTP